MRWGGAGRGGGVAEPATCRVRPTQRRPNGEGQARQNEANVQHFCSAIASHCLRLALALVVRVEASEYADFVSRETRGESVITVPERVLFQGLVLERPHCRSLMISY